MVSLLVLPGGETVRDHGSGALQVGSEKMIYLGFLERWKVCFTPPPPGTGKVPLSAKSGVGSEGGGIVVFMYLYVPYGDLGDRG